MTKAAVLVLLCLCSSVSAQTLNFVGRAYSIESDELLYQERHRLTIEAGLPVQEDVQYLSAENQLLGQKTLQYSAPARPAFALSLPEQDRYLAVEVGTDGVVISGEQEGFVAWPEDPSAVIDGGFHYFILDHFDTLLAGESLPFQFLIASRLRWVAMTITPQTPDDDQMVLTLTPQSRMLSWLLDPIELTYQVSQPRLLEYRGLTALPTGEGGSTPTRLVYQYEAPTS